MVNLSMRSQSDVRSNSAQLGLATGFPQTPCVALASTRARRGEAPRRRKGTVPPTFTSKEVFMSACTVWELILAVAALVSTVFAYRYKSLANRMKTRARIYIKYVPSGELTGEKRVVFEDLKKDLGLK